ncbi:MAG: hypothetical protein GY757_42980, partial [bacterium]|nr:hypothetical protein [bacterium]
MKEKEEKILLLLLPFWPPLVPPLGISELKAYLKTHGYEVKAVDANTGVELRECYDNYFEILKTFVPENKRGNFYNIGTEVWQNHMMSHLNHDSGELYGELVKIVIAKTFYVDVEEEQIRELNRTIAELYRRLEKYIHQTLEKEKPAVLGISVYSTTLPASLFAFKLAKERNPQIRT